MKNKDLKTKNVAGLALIYVILLGVFNLLVFTIFKNRTNVFYLSYAFMTLAFVVQIVSMLLAFKTTDVETAFFGIPLASFSVYYLCAALVIGLLFMIFQSASFTLALVIQLLVLAAFLVIAILSLMARDTTVQINDDYKEKRTFRETQRVEIELLRDSCADAELKESLRKLAETVKYSDPMSTEAVADVERRIMQQFSELRVCLEDGRVGEAKDACRALERLYIERNRKLAISK